MKYYKYYKKKQFCILNILCLNLYTIHKHATFLILINSINASNLNFL